MPPGGHDGGPAEATRYDKHGWEVGPRGPSLGNDPSAGSPTERVGVGAVYSPPRSPGGPDYILSGTAARPTHFHLVCGRSPYPPEGDLGASLRIAHPLCRSRTIQIVCYHPPCRYHGPPGGFPPRVGAIGFRVSPAVRECRRRPAPREGTGAPTCMAARAGLESCRAYPLRGCKGFDKCTLRKDSLSSIRAKTYGGETLLRLLLPLNDRVWRAFRP